MPIIPQLSPGVRFQEFDTSQTTSTTSTWIGGIAGIFAWGPIGQLMTINSVNTLAQIFGPPTANNYETWMTAQSFLAYSDNLLVSRAANTTDNTGVHGVLTAVGNVSSTNLLNCVVENPTQFAAKEITGFDPNVYYIARYPGALGNALRVAVCDTPSQFSSNLSLTTANVTATFTMNVGSNTATIVAIDNDAGVLANTFMINLIDSMSIGDRILIGNVTIGQFYAQISSLPNVPTNNTGANSSSVTISFYELQKLKSNWTSNTIISRYWEFFDAVAQPPGQSSFVYNNGNTAANDELHVVVVDDGGSFSGVPGTILEIYADVSRAIDAENNDGTTNYVKFVINQNSNYIYYVNDRLNANSANALLITSSTATAPLDMTLQGGTFGDSETNAAFSVIANAYDLFQDASTVTVDLIMQGKPIGVSYTQLINYISDNILTERLDCVGFASPNLNTVLNNKGYEASSIVAWKNLARDNTYIMYDTGYKQMYDLYNNVYRWIPLNGDIAGLCAQTLYAWISPAGFNRGYIKNFIQLAYSPSKTDRDTLYTNSINPVVSFPSMGTVLYGDKTGTLEATAFSRINVRRLFIYLERIITQAAQYTLFELNDAFTRAQFVALITPILRTVEGLRGLYDYQVICDSTNNPGYVIDQNQFVADIFLKPEKSINFISLSFVAVGTDVNFTTVENTAPF